MRIFKAFRRKEALSRRDRDSLSEQLRGDYGDEGPDDIQKEEDQEDILCYFELKNNETASLITEKYGFEVEHYLETHEKDLLIYIFNRITQHNPEKRGKNIGGVRQNDKFT